MAHYDNSHELLPLVDEQGNMIGSTTRGECHSGSKLLHPVVHLHVFNSQGELYLQKRPSWKDIQPNKWDTAVGGHIDLGEDTETALKREAREELNITDFIPEFSAHYIFESEYERELIFAYKTIYDEAIHPTDELDDGRFWTMQEIRDTMETGMFTPNFENEFKRLFSSFGKQ
ncbi:MAG: Nudix hydrolase [Candidatus Ordinivivax streblomastigis]|uniref:Nudix hydrolase n=1 Tax=Candidatus Ordinivivax streblomastigis TaxID=2540710 RepID=A0A5M8NWQ0_9BACT|nr:MAG: Nudix hydrolase [Candidatus Ordinivivax streblomastigis]